jgi:hypothetical protein
MHVWTVVLGQTPSERVGEPGQTIDGRDQDVLGTAVLHAPGGLDGGVHRPCWC